MNFAAPIWLYLIPVVLLVLWGGFHLAGAARRKQLSSFAADRLLGGLLRSYSPTRRRFKHILIALGLTLLLLALARPQFGYTWRDTTARGIDVLFVLDTSKSMLAEDIRPNRMERAKYAIMDFTRKLQGDRVGLVAFAGNAFLQCPLTLDYGAFELSLEAINTDIIQHGGTDIARALQEAENAFRENSNHKIIILMTDGEDLEENALEQARIAAENGVTIYSVGVGTPDGQLIPINNRFGQREFLRDSSGKLVTTKLDEATLSDIAEITNGFYVRLGASGFGMEQVYEAGIESIPEEELGVQRQRIWLERFQWPLAIALFLLAWEPLVGTRRFRLRSSASALGLIAVMLFLIHATPLQAAASSPENLYGSGKYDEAASAYRTMIEQGAGDNKAHYNLGNSLYAQGVYGEAIAAYEDALVGLDLELQADAFYNLGNARYYLGKQSRAETPDPHAVQQTSQQAIAGARSAIGAAQDILWWAHGSDDLGISSDSSQKPKVSQDEIRQGIQSAEQAKEAASSAITEGSTLAEADGETLTYWESAANDFRSSLELDPNGEDARYNLDFVQAKVEELRKRKAALEENIAQHEQDVSELERLIEELKKLLEEEQNDQNQDQQDQPQNQNQQQEDQQQQEQQDQNSDSSQSQDSSDSQQGDSGEQSQSDQQSQSDSSSEQEQSKQRNSESEQRESTENSDSADEQTPQENAQQQGEQESTGENQQDDNAQEPQQQSGQDQAGSQSEEQSPQAESGQDESGPEQQPTGADSEAGLSEEQQRELSEQLAQQGGEDDEKEAKAASLSNTGEPLPRIPGAMSREEARRLLDSLKSDEKKLSSISPQPQYNRDDNGQRKDW